MRRVCKRIFASEIKTELLLYQKVTAWCHRAVYLREATDHSRRRAFPQKSCLICTFSVFSRSRKLPESYLLLCTWRICKIFGRRPWENIFQHIYEALEYRISIFLLCLFCDLRYVLRDHYETRSIISWIFQRNCDLGHFHHHKYRRRCRSSRSELYERFFPPVRVST